jgi:capsular polysaccharide biosynthesis protein
MNRGTGLDLRDYLRIFRRNWITIVALALAGLLVGGAASLLVHPTYTASTQLFVAIQSSGTVTELQQGNTFSQARVQSYVKTVTTPVVLNPVVDTLGLTESPEQLAERINATSDPDTVLITITASDPSPAQAAAIAQAVGAALSRQSTTWNGQKQAAHPLSGCPSSPRRPLLRTHRRQIPRLIWPLDY